MTDKAKGIFESLKKLNKKKKIQLVTALTLTAALLVALPLYAWFTHKRSIAMTTAINAPTKLYITAANKESVTNLEMADIDVESEIKYKDFVFGVGGEDVSRYQIQLAHTTNIPFTYTIYRATLVDSNGTDIVDYAGEDGNTYHYKIDGNAINGTFKNQSTEDAKLANSTIHDKSYETYSQVQKNAEALYWQSEILDVEDKTTNKSFCDYFIIRVSWDKTLKNDKETDMVYLTVQRSN